MTTTTWNPLDKGASAVLSNGNLTITTAPSTYAGARGTTSHTAAGKYYFELTVNSVGGTSAFAFGLANATAGLSGYIPGLDVNSTGYSLFADAFLFKNQIESFGTLGTIIVGSVYGIAIDFATSNMWVRGPNGVWNGRAGDDPATNVGGLNSSPYFGTGGLAPFPTDWASLWAVNLYPYLAVYNNSEGTANFGATAFTYSVPSGFVAWDAVAPVPTNYTPGTGSIELAGHAPSLQNVANTFYPGTGHIRLTGQLPKLAEVELFDASVTVISQYANSPAILQMVQNFAAWIAPGQLLNDFYNLIWNIDSAVGYGLDVWGRIVGVGRVLHVATDAVYFGFEEASTGDHVTGFNQAPFYDGQSVTANFSLSDGAYRQLILAKAAANICNGSIPAINQVLIDIFGSSGNAYVVDNEDMTMTYHFTFPLDPVQEAIVNNSGVLPKPAGVLATVYSP